IRAATVTGVQTCALPILSLERAFAHARPQTPDEAILRIQDRHSQAATHVKAAFINDTPIGSQHATRFPLFGRNGEEVTGPGEARSEERRVGKGWRCRGAR